MLNFNDLSDGLTKAMLAAALHYLHSERKQPNALECL